MISYQLLIGADRIPLEKIVELEKQSPNLIVYAAPIMIFFAALEIFIAWYQDKEYHNAKEVGASLIVGLGNVAINLLLKSLLLIPIVYFYNLVPWRMSFSWWGLILCYIVYDLASYWAHRVSHGSRFWWATHVVHHSADHYNLTVSFRLSWVQNLKIIFFIPVMLFGFHPIAFFITNQVATLFQFWVHTEYIKKMPAWFEYIFATPSNHRVHHGSQPLYIDKNFGATFIIWDRIFGTFQKEEEPVAYGITTPLERKGDPFYINFHEYKDIWVDVKQTAGMANKMNMIFGNPTKIATEKNNKAVLQKKSAGQTEGTAT